MHCNEKAGKRKEEIMNTSMFDRWRLGSQATQGLQHRKEKKRERHGKTSGKAEKRARPKYKKKRRNQLLFDHINKKKGRFQSHKSIGLVKLK